MVNIQNNEYQLINYAIKRKNACISGG